MNRILNPVPATEELMMGYVPSALKQPGQGSVTRKFFITLFVIMGLATGMQMTVVDLEESGQRRLAETGLGDRKGGCRECSEHVLTLSTAKGIDHVPSSAAPVL